MSAILVVTGTQREAAVLRGANVVVIAGGGDAAGLRAKLTAAAPAAGGVLSFGFAGALDPALRIGDWVVGERVTGAIDLPCDSAWSAALAAALRARTGSVHADGRLAATVADKRALAGSAIAVDMESHIVAEVAAAYGLPFAILRCISDEAGHAMPPAIRVAMRADGGVDGPAMLRSLLTQPTQLTAFTRSVGAFLEAMRALRRGGTVLERVTGHAVAASGC